MPVEYSRPYRSHGGCEFWNLKPHQRPRLWDHVVETHAPLPSGFRCFSGRFTLAHACMIQTPCCSSRMRPASRFQAGRFTTVDFTEDNSMGNRQFETFTTHIFNQHGQVQFATTGYTNASASSVSSCAAPRYAPPCSTVKNLDEKSQPLLYRRTASVNAEEHRHGRPNNGQRRRSFCGSQMVSKCSARPDR